MSDNLPAIAGTDAVFRLMDTLDDKQIIEQLEGRLPEVLTYHFSDGKTEVWGLSKNGIDECKAEMAKKGEIIREVECECIDQGDEAFFKCKAERIVVASTGQEVRLDTAFGFKRQPKKSPRGSFNSFWYEQGSIKSCRNAVSRLIPSAIKEAVIAYAKAGGKVKELDATDVTVIEVEKKPAQSRADMPASEAQTRTLEKLMADFGVELVTICNDMESDGVYVWGNRVVSIDSLNRDEAQAIIDFVRGG
jgi:hypothetical protein